MKCANVPIDRGTFRIPNPREAAVGTEAQTVPEGRSFSHLHIKSFVAQRLSLKIKRNTTHINVCRIHTYIVIFFFVFSSPTVS